MNETIQPGDIFHAQDEIGEFVGIVHVVNFEEDNVIVERKDGDNYIYKTFGLSNWVHLDFVRKEKDDTPQMLLLKAARAQFGHFTIRRKNMLLKRNGYNGEEFFYGHTTVKHDNTLHMESIQMNYMENFGSSLYYQAGDYSHLALHDGQIQFTETFNQKIHKSERDFMMGLARQSERGDRYYKWCYCGTGPQQRTRPLYNLYLLIMYGKDYYVFRGKSNQQILDELYCNDPNDPNNGHVYQAYAQVLVFNGKIPEDWNLGDLEEKIKTNLSWVLETFEPSPKSPKSPESPKKVDVES